jgi:cell division protein FtsW
VQKLFYLPEPHSDFIYAVISEELGLVGRTRRAHLLLRDHLARSSRGDEGARHVRGVRRAGIDDHDCGAGTGQHQRRARDDADQGIPLPFVSAGGSSLLINLLGMGVLLNVSRHVSSEA